MKILCVFVFVIISLNLVLVESRGINGGLNCAVCTIVSGVIQQKAYLEGVSIYIAARKFCKQLPHKLQDPCYTVVEALEPFFLNKLFLNAFTPDLFCYAIRSCRIDPGENFCHLFPEPHLYKKRIAQLENVMKEHNVYEILNKLQLPENFNEFEIKSNRIQDITNFVYLTDWENVKTTTSAEFPDIDFCKMPIFKVICDIVIGKFGDLKPAVDLDDDGFSVLRLARGSDWRGKDCSDINPSVYPGALTKNSDTNIDHNCNGIWGNDPESGKPWEEILCSDSKSRGIAYIGDSIGAHFHMPESWINPMLKDKSSPATIMEVLLDEIDWPELGYFSGFMNSSYPNLINGSVDSLYLRMRNLNLCSHRDYQNSARNAALAVGGISQAKSISRKPSDKPVLVIYAMLGNDVCNRFNDTVENMTKPEDFRKSVLEALNILDKKLPRGSDVVLVSLIDGSFIYPAMAERVHPLGTLFDNIHYKDLYEWYTCMQIGPCNGWMTPNVTLREITTKKAEELSSVLKDISLHSKFDSFNVHFLKNPLNTAIDNWVAQGGQIYEFIDPIDSTHPTQVAQPYMAAALWDSLNELNILGSPNPHNEKIKEIFGDQGGH